MASSAEVVRKSWPERYGTGLAFVLGVLLVIAGTILTVVGQQASAFVLAGAALAGVAAMSGVVESIKAAGLEVKLREQNLRKVADQLEEVKDKLQSALDPSVDGHVGDVDVTNVLTQAVEVLRENPTDTESSITPTPVLRATSRDKFYEAVAWVMELERAAGREPIGATYRDSFDVISSGRRIEVKLLAGTSRMITMTGRQWDDAHADPDFWLYLATPLDDGHEPFEVRALGGEPLRQFLEGSQRMLTYRVHMPRDVSTLGEVLEPA